MNVFVAAERVPDIVRALARLGIDRRRVSDEGWQGWFLSAESIAVFKLLFFRAKDLVDLERLIAVQGADLDGAYVRRWLVDMMGDDDERVLRWDAMRARFAVSSSP